MERRRFLSLSAGGLTTPLAFSTRGSATKDKELDGLWIRDFEGDDFELIVQLLLDYHEGVSNLDAEQTEENAINNVSSEVVDVSEPLVNLYDTTSPDALEHSINYGPRLANTDVELVFSLLEEVERAYDMDIPRRHILAASRRAFLFKSLVAASINFYLACEAIDSAEELTEKLRMDFYYSLLILLVEVVLAKYPFDYWIAWRGTRYIHNQFLVRARSILGDRGIAVVMKFIHWSLIRGNVSVDFTENFYESVTEFLVEEGHGEKIYNNIKLILEEMDDEYSLYRWEDYGGQTNLKWELSSVEFMVDSLLIPVGEAVEGDKESARQQLIRAVKGVSGDVSPEVIKQILAQLDE